LPALVRRGLLFRRAPRTFYPSSSIFKFYRNPSFQPTFLTMSTADAVPTPDVEAKDTKDAKGEKRGEKRSADAEVTNGSDDKVKHLKGAENGDDYEDDEEEDVNEEDDDDDEPEEEEGEGDDDDEEDDTNDVPEDDDDDEDDEE